MIINTGMRTDIPAFYTDWFVNRLKAGFVLVRNPYNPRSVTRYRLSPDVVDLIGFCTKNPAPMLPHMDLLHPYGQYWFVTITPYGKEIEPYVQNKRNVLESFKQLSDIVGVDSIGWRYDPIFISDQYPVERHIKAFEYMAKELSGYTRTAVISFIDLYGKTKRNFPEAKQVTAEQRLKMPKTTPARKECACYLGGDIGAYNTCGHLCRYCYANYDAETVRKNMAMHDPESPLLIGHLYPEDQVHEAKQKSWVDPQIVMPQFESLFRREHHAD